MDNKFLTNEDINRLVEESKKLKPGEMVEGKLISHVIDNNGEYQCTTELHIDKPVINGGKILEFPGNNSAQIHSSKTVNPPKNGFSLIKGWADYIKSQADSFVEGMFPGDNQEFGDNCFVDQNNNLYWVEEDEYGNKRYYIEFPGGIRGEFTSENRCEIKIDGVFYPIDEMGNILWDQGQEPEPNGPKRK